MAPDISRHNGSLQGEKGDNHNSVMMYIANFLTELRKLGLSRFLKRFFFLPVKIGLGLLVNKSRLKIPDLKPWLQQLKMSKCLLHKADIKLTRKFTCETTIRCAWILRNLRSLPLQVFSNSSIFISSWESNIEIVLCLLYLKAHGILEMQDRNKNVSVC